MLINNHTQYYKDPNKYKEEINQTLIQVGVAVAIILAVIFLNIKY